MRGCWDEGGDILTSIAYANHTHRRLWKLEVLVEKQLVDFLTLSTLKAYCYGEHALGQNTTCYFKAIMFNLQITIEMAAF